MRRRGLRPSHLLPPRLHAIKRTDGGAAGLRKRRRRSRRPVSRGCAVEAVCHPRRCQGACATGYDSAGVRRRQEAATCCSLPPPPPAPPPSVVLPAAALRRLAGVYRYGSATARVWVDGQRPAAGAGRLRLYPADGGGLCFTACSSGARVAFWEVPGWSSGGGGSRAAGGGAPAAVVPEGGGGRGEWVARPSRGVGRRRPAPHRWLITDAVAVGGARRAPLLCHPDEMAHV